ncbi:helix-turn-helix domain-containing protein [Cohnella hongkongensis]|uniref:Helix-turn-helix domain-containing protein n=1 Tax=Cohnella hongkongensis TaxID=178337 RepID=A0ABV9F6G3_9BACL
MSLEWMPSAVDLNRVRFVRSGDFVVKPGWVYGPVRLDSYQIVYFPTGSETRYVSTDKSFVLGKPCVIITPPGETYSYEFDKAHPVRHLFLTFYLDWTAVGNPEEERREESVFLHSVEETFVPQLMKQILFLSSKKVYLWEERCKLLLLSALAELEGLKGMPSPKSAPVFDTKHSLPVLKALDYIDRHLTEPITVVRLAQEAGWSHEHFTRKFVQYTGISPQKAILMRRIDRACQLLVTEGRSISEIAYAVGFQSVHYFYRSFMSVKGVTASRYRQQFSAPHLKHLSPVNELETSYPLNHYYYYN